MDELSTHISHTSEVYDALPYDDHPVFRSHPSRMAATAKLFGFDANPLQCARVLELGCAAGGNIIPLACFNPEAEFLGIDLGGRMIADGQARIAAAGLTNIELRHQSITDLGEDIGEFDYIICHGVYSWVPEPVREAILAICGRHLSRNGIAYISYNVLPGWRMMQPLRDAFRLMIPHDLPARDRVKLGKQLIRYLVDMAPAKDAYSAVLRSTEGLLDGMSETYLYHEYMEEVNEPTAFSDFVSDAGRHGLTYLAEAELSVMFAERFEGDFAEKLAKTTRGDIVSHEQMLDILSGNPFRTTLLVRSGMQDNIDRNLNAGRLEDLHFIGSYLFAAKRDDKAIILSARGGTSRRYDDPHLVGLIERFFFGPALTSKSFAELTDGLNGDSLAEQLQVLLNMIISGVIIVLDAPTTAVAAGENPVANPMARIDAALGRDHTANRAHLSIEIDELAQFLASRLDGTLNRAELGEQLHAAFVDGSMEITARGGGKPQADELPDIARASVDFGLQTLSSSGLLDA